MSDAKDIITLDDLIKNLQDIKKAYGGNIPVTYSADDEGNRFSFTKFNAAVIFYAGKPKDVRLDYTLEPVSDKEHKNKDVASFVAVIVN